MSNGLVQEKDNVSASGTSVGVTLTSSVTAGNSVVVAVVGFNDGTPSTVSGGSDSFTQLVADSNGNTEIFYVLSSAGGYTSLTISNANTVGIVAWVYEVSPLSATDSSLSNSSVSQASPWSSNSTSGGFASEFVVGVAASTWATSATGMTGPSSPWSNEAFHATTGAVPVAGGVSGYQVATATGSYTYSGTGTGTGSAEGFGSSVAVFKFTDQGGGPDQGQVLPGPVWLKHYKPWMPKPRPPVPKAIGDPANAPNLRDRPVINPGPVWLGLLRPGRPKPKPYLLAGASITCTGGAALQPYTTSGTGSVTPGFTGGANLAPFKASGTVHVPVVATGAVTVQRYKTSGSTGVPVVASGGAVLAPYTVVTPSNLRDLPHVQPGPAWLNRFKQPLRGPLKIPGGPGMMGARGAVAVPPYRATGQATVFLPFPQFNLNLLYEILVNGTWQDVTSFVYWRSDQVITRGLPDETQSATPSQLTLTLNNRDGRFSPNNTAGAYYPYLTRNVQLRCSIVNQASAGGAATYTGYRFWGEMSSIPPSWDNTGRDVFCNVTVSGPLRRYVQAAAMGSALRQYYSTLSGNLAPYATWPCEDGSQATQFASLLPGVGAMTFTGSPQLAGDASFGGSDPIPVISSSTWQGQTGAAADPPGTGSVTQRFPGTYTWTAPPGVTQVTAVKAVGGGGGGGDTDGTTGGGGGGGGGAQSSATVAVTPGVTYTYVVGTGGAAGSGGAGGNGTGSTFTGDSATITGGGGHGGGLAGLAGAGGSGTRAGGHGGTGQSSSSSSGSQVLYGSSGSTGGGRGTSSSVSGGSDAGGNSAIWTAPSGVTTVNVNVQAGGGGGGPGDGSGGGGGGGEGGGLSTGSVSVTPGNGYSITAGNGGAGASGGEGSPSSGTGIGTQGGSSTFTGDSGTLSAQGGVGGAHNPGSSGSGGGSGGSGHANNTGSGFYGGGGAGGDAQADGGGTGANSPGRAGGGAGASGGAGGYGKVYPSGSGATPGSTGSYGGGGGAGGSSNTLGGVYGSSGGGGGFGFTGWSWTQTGAPSGGGGGSSAGTSANGTAGSNSGTGGTAPSGGGSGGSTGTTPAGLLPGGGGAGAVPSNAAVGNTAYTAGGGAAGEVTFSWSGGVTSPVPADIVRFLLHVDPTGAADGAVLLRVLTYGTVAQCDVVYHTGGHLELIGYNASSVQVFDSGLVAFGADGTPLYVDVELTSSGSNVAWLMTAIEPGAGSVVTTASGTVAGSVGNVQEVITDPAGAVTDSATSLGWVTVQTYADTMVNMSPIVAGYAGETAAARIARLCASQGLGFELVGNASDTPLMGPQQDAKFTDVLQSCADLDRGQLYETRDQFGIGYRTRVSMQGQAPDLIAYYGQGMLAGNLQPTADDQFTRNDITVTRNGGASASAALTSGPMSTMTPPNGVGDYTYGLTVQANNDGQLANLAAWVLTVGTVAGYRFPQVTFDLARSEVAALLGEIPALDVGDFVQVPDPPSFLQNTPVNQLAFGFTETLNARKWTISVNCVPEDPYSEPAPPTW